MIKLAYFILLQTGNYKGTNSPTTPFQLKYVSLSCGAANFNTLQTLAAALKTATYVKLDFTTMKNAMLGEVVRNGTSVDAMRCPKSALVCRFLYVREKGSTPSQNLATFKIGGRWVNITPADISIMLKDVVRFLGPSLVFMQKCVSTRSLRVAGTMDLL